MHDVESLHLQSDYLGKQSSHHFPINENDFFNNDFLTTFKLSFKPLRLKANLVPANADRGQSRQKGSKVATNV